MKPLPGELSLDIWIASTGIQCRLLADPAPLLRDLPVLEEVDYIENRAMSQDTKQQAGLVLLDELQRLIEYVSHPWP